MEKIKSPRLGLDRLKVEVGVTFVYGPGTIYGLQKLNAKSGRWNPTDHDVNRSELHEE
jgi:hypothetical protein